MTEMANQHTTGVQPEQAAPIPAKDLDPFDPANLRVDLSSFETGGVKKLVTTVPVRKPNRQDFIRVHPDEKYRNTFAMIELKDDREIFIVSPAIAQSLQNEVS